MMDRRVYGVFFIAALVVAAAWWGRSSLRGKFMGIPQDSPVTTDAGSEVPTVPVSNTPADTGRAWFPYYLVSNYPSDRGGDNVAPSLVKGGMAEYYGPQEILPQV